MTTQHTHPEHGDVDARDALDQHAQETGSRQETSAQFEQQAPTFTNDSPPLPTPLSFNIAITSPATTGANEASQAGETNETSNTFSDSPETIGEMPVSESITETFVDENAGTQAQEQVPIEVQLLSPDEQIPLEPAPFALTYDATASTSQEQEETSTQYAQEMPQAENTGSTAQEQVDIPVGQDANTNTSTSVGTDEVAVRPFMEYIEEFRLKEERTGSLDTFTEFSSSLTDTNTTSQFQDVESVNEEVLPPFDFGEGSSFVPATTEPTSDAIIDTNAPLDAGTRAESSLDAARAEESQRTEAVNEALQEQGEETRLERPVSPLLRPSSRHRLRHGASRHREEFVRSTANEAPTATPAETAPLASSSPVPGTSGEQAQETAPAETPKPARRYRFDRPAQSGTPYKSPVARPVGASTQQSATTNGVSEAAVTQPAAQQPSTSTTNEVSASSTNDLAPSTSTTSLPVQEEQNLKRETASTTTVEQNAVTSPTSQTSTPVEHGRRKHGQDRQERQREKEQQATLSAPIETTLDSVADIAALVAETHEALEGNVAPEDLPPLEYADLQKANSRRRRRHRNGQVTPQATKTLAEQEAQGVPVMSQEAQETQEAQPATRQTPYTPAQPAQPAATQAPAPAQQAQAAPLYSLTSGFTVNQMNQGNDQVGPFMGPEPSPARGSVFTRDGRTTRAETMRPSSYNSRDNGSNGGGLSSASMNHFANVVSHAIQIQTDRMVAEMRTASQAPTNVSVSLPPFPSTERVGVFVDVANLLYSARTMRVAIDFGKLLNFLRGNRRLIRAQAYCPTSPQAGDEQMFLQAVKGLGYRITTKNYKIFASGAKKADLDLDLCMDVVRLVDGRAVDCIVLVSGDSDFMPMLDYCSDHGVRVEIAAFDEAMSATLRQSCDLFINLAMLDEIRA